MTEEETYRFLKANLNSRIQRKDLPYHIKIGYLTLCTHHWKQGRLIENPDDEFTVSDAGKDFIAHFEERLKPLFLAEEANKIAKSARNQAFLSNIVATISLALSVYLVLTR